MAYALLLFTFAASEDTRLRLALLASMALIVVALLFTFSRGAFVGFAVVNLLFLLSRRRPGALLLAAGLLAALPFLLPGAVYDRLLSGWDQGWNAISAGRIDEIWLPLLPEIGGSPLIGHGLGAILWSEAMRAGAILPVTHPHNAYLQALLDVGGLGLLLLLAYFAQVWRGFRRLACETRLDPARRGFYAGAAAGLASFLVAGFAGSSLLPVPEQCFLWLAIGMMEGDRVLLAEGDHAGRG
jgi:O-antigen ligase